ncbi:MAG: AmmeMemoRadiSam system radical SAM enzyme, partial [Deltaproteobacteria bacterium]|nr:AmmeMemoRadiSam system radical SAM enzyme [Deltaproteobacteria bacterium]
MSNTTADHREASLWRPLGDGRVECALCSFRCKIAEGRRGICHVRENIDGRLTSLNYGRVIAAGIDPIEKKPLFHFLPGSLSYSIATAGCNFHCLHCQNAAISQVGKNAPIEGIYREPNKIVSEATALGAETIAYTYTEPTIFYEYARDVMELAHKAKLKNIFVTNGYMTEETLNDMDGLLDAANVDLKTFNDKTYRKLCGAKLQPVLDTIERMVALGIWVEVTTLIIPTINDSEAELR